MAQSAFVGSGPALLRLPVLTAASAAMTRRDVTDPDWATEFLRLAVADPVLREAIEVSSGSLAATLDRIERGDVLTEARRQRAALAVARYVLRMAGRPTPFGLAAGVATASFSTTAAKVRLGEAHRKGVRVDSAWLASVVERLEQAPAVLRTLRVTVNDLCFVRGDRLVLPYVRAKARELSVRRTPVVEAVRELLADRPRVCAELVEQLAARFPDAAAERIAAMVRTLIAQEILLTDLHPPISATDPLGYVMERLAVSGVPPELRSVAEALSAYTAQPVGQGMAQWREATRLMHRLEVTERPPVQVDLRVDADVRLPQAVLAEVERAASALWRLSSGDPVPSYLREYHGAFLEQYGTSRLVPVREVLDPEAGLGAPAGYQVPRSSRRDPRDGESERNDQVLGALLQEAMLSGGEAVLDDALLDRLAQARAAGPQSSMELGVHVLARSVDALERGDFRLAVAPVAGHSAGAVFGRFAYLFDDVGYLTGLVEDDQAQLVFRPVADRHVNVVRVPSVCRRTLAVGIFADHAAPEVLRLDDVLIGADLERLYLVGSPSGRELKLFSPHMLNTRFATPNAVRLLREIAAFGHREWRPWSWGPFAALPYVPRVRYGRTVLTAARWRPPTDLDEPGLAAWCSQWRVPPVVHASFADHRLELDLTEPLHRRLLHQELRRRGEVRLVEPPGPPEEFGWLDGRAHELVVPLVPAQRVPARRLPVAVARGSAVRHPPGGEWAYAKLYSGTERHDELLAEHVPELRARAARWFFIRYADPEPHLRLRFHGRAEELNSALLPTLHEWAGKLCTASMARKLVLDTYEPEVVRYGGVELFGSATEVFQADSDVALQLIRRRQRGELEIPGELLAAASAWDLVRAFGMGVDWVLAAFAKDEHHSAFQEHRRAALRLVGSAEPFGSDPAWYYRRWVVADYGRRVLTANGRLPVSADSVLASLLHMHVNRLLGVDRQGEQRTYAILRGAVQAQYDRERHGS